MIQVLKDEETTDIDQRDWCKETTYKIEKIEAKITKLIETKEELEDAIVATDAEILATHEELDEMEATQTAENGVFFCRQSRMTRLPLACSE